MTKEEEDRLNQEFIAEAKRAEAAEKDRAANKGKYTPKEYETLNWSGLEKGTPGVYRLLDTHPDLNLLENSKPGSSYDGRVINQCLIIDDKGKQRKFIIPCRNKDDSHIMWRIIDAVTAIEWVDKNDGTGKKMRKHINETKHPEIFSMVTRNKFPVNDKNFGLKVKGWSGREVYITNVIDRTNAQWHKENKHTRLLAKSVNVSKGDDGQDKVWIDEGIPAFGFTSELNRLFKTYGIPTQYDIAIEKTGKQNPSLVVFNASRTPEMCNGNEKYVVTGSLTDEERAYTRYDLDKLFPISTYTKIYNALNRSIAMIDLALGTHFLPELKSLSDEEKAKWDAEAKLNNNSTQNNNDVDDEDEEASHEPVREAKVVHREVEEEEEEVRSVRKERLFPPAWDKLSRSEQDAIVDAHPLDDGTPTWDITYAGDPPIKSLPKCPECKTRSPKEFTRCPVCGNEFGF